MRAVPQGPSVEPPSWGHEALYWVGERKGAMAVVGGGGRMRAVPLGASVEPPPGPRNAASGGCNAGSKGPCWVVADACGRCHWDFPWSSLMGPRTA
eukprot:1502242-Pyramimonas_sp.AAC.1